MSKKVIKFKKVTKKYFKGGRYQPSFREWIYTLITGNSFQRPQFTALDNLSFSITKGQVVGFIGSNGAGKSTILKLISKITFPNNGQVTVSGSVAGLLELGTGFHPELTGKENVFLYASILGMKKKQIKKMYSQVVEFAGIKEFMDSPIKHYSSGMLARLGFSVASHIEPEILLIDEVLSVGDLAFQEKCMKFMKDYCKNPNHTVVFVSHHLENVKSICDRVIWIEHGEIVYDGTAKEVIPKYIKYQKKKNG